MPRFTVGCVPYVNAIPLSYPFVALGDASPVRIVYEVPSKLPAMLDGGEAQAVLVSAFDPLTTPGRTLVPGVCIGSEGPVSSVRLFSRRPLDQIRSLALDSSSMTSNALARILLRSLYGAEPELSFASPDVTTMLEQCDACVVIGDIGMASESPGAYVLDLGEAWSSWTGLPFVWAAWVGGATMAPELVDLLRSAYEDPSALGVESHLELWVSEAARQSNFDPSTLRAYFTQAMRYPLDERSLAGLERFRACLSELGLSTHPPRLAGAASATAV